MQPDPLRRSIRNRSRPPRSAGRQRGGAGRNHRGVGDRAADVVGSAVQRGIINPLPTRAQIAANLVARDKRYDWTPEAVRQNVLSEVDPEAGQAELNQRVEKVYGSIVAAAEADLEKTHRMASSVMPFVGLALAGAALAAAGAWAEPCLVVGGTSSAAGTAAAGGFAAFAGAIGFWNWASGRGRASAAAGVTVSGGTDLIVSPIYTFENHDFLTVRKPSGVRQGFYRSTGNNSGMPGAWLPYDEHLGHLINKYSYTEAGGFPEGDVLHRFGSMENLEISNALGHLNLPPGGIPLNSSEQVNIMLDLTGAQITQFNFARPVGAENGQPVVLPDTPPARFSTWRGGE